MFFYLLTIIFSGKYPEKGIIFSGKYPEKRIIFSGKYPEKWIIFSGKYPEKRIIFSGKYPEKWLIQDFFAYFSLKLSIQVACSQDKEEISFSPSLKLNSWSQNWFELLITREEKQITYLDFHHRTSLNVSQKPFILKSLQK